MQILLGLLVSPFEWDSVAYHLPFAVQYLQEGAFTPWKSPFWTYPCIYEMLLAWILLLFQGDFGVHLLNVIFLLFMLVTLVAIAEKIDLSPGAFGWPFFYFRPVRRRFGNSRLEKRPRPCMFLHRLT